MKEILGKIWDDWKPGYLNNLDVYVDYDKSWFCYEEKKIHANKNSFINCKKCKDYYADKH